MKFAPKAQKCVGKRLHHADPIACRRAELAAKTYVPETEASRLAGAGAGLTDND